ncbi:MAG: sensor histidine kinase [Hyphomonadaceae bacterium]|nr:sensor histidine kinase [Hyphomonadaceae bacterium]
MRARLIAVAALASLVLILVGASTFALFQRQLTRQLVDPELVSVIDQLIRNARADAEGGLAFPEGFVDSRYERAATGRYFQVAAIESDGSVRWLYASRSLFDVSLPLTRAQERTLITAAETAGSFRGVAFLDLPTGPDGAPMRAAARVSPIPSVDGDYLFIAALAPRQTLGPAANLVAIAFAVFVGVCVAILAAVTALQVRVGLAPLGALQRDIAAVRRGGSERLTGAYALEIAPLAQELNALLDHNREVVERARRHVGNLAHALKTPIAALKNAAALGGGDAAATRQTIADMESFVERQLRRARVAARAEARAGDAGATVGYRTPVRENLQALIFMMEQKYDPIKAIDVRLEPGPDATFRGEREDLLEMAANLVDNACKYGTSEVVVRVAPPSAPGGLLEIVVEDDGPGLTDEQVAIVLKRGERLDEAAPGQGLGLSILTEAVELYAGALSFERSALGGLKARLRLPATD